MLYPVELPDQIPVMARLPLSGNNAIHQKRCKVNAFFVLLKKSSLLKQHNLPICTPEAELGMRSNGKCCTNDVPHYRLEVPCFVPMSLRYMVVPPDCDDVPVLRPRASR